MADTKRGRPRIDATDPSVMITTSIPSRQYEALCDRARRESVTVAELMRRALRSENSHLKNRQNG